MQIQIEIPEDSDSYRVVNAIVALNPGLTFRGVYESVSEDQFADAMEDSELLEAFANIATKSRDEARKREAKRLREITKARALVKQFGNKKSRRKLRVVGLKQAA